MASGASLQTVLVIDDERGPRESLRILLKNEYNVLCADSVDWGLDLLQQNRPDVVVMDIRMPGKGGIQGLREIRQIDPVVSVVMLTGFGSLETAQEAIRLGANDYVRKPFDAPEMQDVIRRNVSRTQLERRRWRAEQELKTLNEELVTELAKKEHLAELGQKSAELVHDLRNPLTAVMGYAELLSDELRRSRDKLGEKWQDTSEYIEMIEKSVRRCKDLADMWLSLGRRDPQRMKPLLVCDLIGDIVRGLKQIAAGRGVRIDCQVAAAVESEISADHVQISRALHNILVNAIEAVSVGSGVIRVGCVPNGPHVEICIEDNGCGMDAEQLGHAFEPYFTTKKFTGTGLGLFITRRVIEDHHGTIEMQSRPNEGTAVRIRLPLLKRAEVAIA